MNFNIKKDQLIDPLYLAKELIKFPSETPRDEGALFFVEEVLNILGFKCFRMPSGEIEGMGKEALVNNLYAKTGRGKTLCFAGHTDVVPAGNKENWVFAPYEAKVHAGMLIGRGAADMKGSIAAAWQMLLSRERASNAFKNNTASAEFLKEKAETVQHFLNFILPRYLSNFATISASSE